MTHIQPKEDMLILGEDDNALDNFGPYKNEESTPVAQNIKGDHRNLVGKSSDTGSCARAGRTLQDGLLGNESSSFLREVRFSEQEFSADIPVFNIKYDHPGSQNDNLFYPFHNQLDFALVHYFAESENTKGNVDKVLFNPLIALLTEKLSY